MAPLSRSPARIASVRIPSESLATLASHRRCWTKPASASAPGPPVPTCARCSPSSASAPVGSSGTAWRNSNGACLLRTSPGRRGPAGDPRWGLRQMRAPLSGRDAAWVTYSTPRAFRKECTCLSPLHEHRSCWNRRRRRSSSTTAHRRCITPSLSNRYRPRPGSTAPDTHRAPHRRAGGWPTA